MRTLQRSAVFVFVVVSLWWLIHQPFYWQLNDAIRTLPGYYP